MEIFFFFLNHKLLKDNSFFFCVLVCVCVFGMNLSIRQQQQNSKISIKKFFY